MRFGERCTVCRRRIRRSESDNATYWYGPAAGNGMARLLIAHQGCYATVPADMHASIRERALLLANAMGRARAERSEASMDTLRFTAAGMATRERFREMIDALQRTVEVEDDDAFRESVEDLLAMAGLTVHERLPDGQTILRREGIDPD
jgi:hypothetical protein